MVFWWCVFALALAVVYMVAYTLLRTSGDGRPWRERLMRPKDRAGRSGRRRSD